MDPQLVFLFKHRELERRCSRAAVSAPQPGPATEYEVLMAAAPLRDLLFGEPQPLLHLANRTHREQILFACSPLEREPGEPGDGQAMSLDGFEGRMRGPTQHLSLHKFLAAPVAHVDGTELSVRDIVDYAAHAAGAVHFGRVDTNKRPQVALMERYAEVQGIDWVLYQLAAIGRVVARALRPLAGAVLTARGGASLGQPDIVIPSDSAFTIAITFRQAGGVGATFATADGSAVVGFEVDGRVALSLDGELRVTGVPIQELRLWTPLVLRRSEGRYYLRIGGFSDSWPSGRTDNWRGVLFMRQIEGDWKRSQIVPAAWTEDEVDAYVDLCHAEDDGPYLEFNAPNADVEAP